MGMQDYRNVVGEVVVCMCVHLYVCVCLVGSEVNFQHPSCLRHIQWGRWSLLTAFSVIHASRA